MNSPLDALEPQLVWRAFDAIRQIPRPSRHEERISAWIRQWAADRGFSVKHDAAGNLAIKVPATPGQESAESVVLQAHLDMVCEKNRGVVHDFDRDPIQVEVVDGWVHARGTTLGADNGIGVALSMAAASDPECVHGPLELLFTVDEETGLNGAMALESWIVEGRTLINLDSEDDGKVYIGCAGALAVAVNLALIRGPGDGEAFELAVQGLRGGHSGLEIDGGRGNAIQSMARVLVAARHEGIDIGLARLEGGDKPNAIPRECFAELRFPPGQRLRLASLLERLVPELKAELHATDPGLEVLLREVEPSPVRPVWGALRDRFLQALDACPSGVIRMSSELPGLVETSVNLAVVRFKAEAGANAEILVGIRSSANSMLEAMAQRLESLFALVPAATTRTRGYPGWQPNPSAPLVRHAVAAHLRLFGADPEIKAVHAGLECGVLGQKLNGLDAVSIGPDIRGAHSPTERVSVASVARSYAWLAALLRDLATN